MSFLRSRAFVSIALLIVAALPALGQTGASAEFTAHDNGDGTWNYSLSLKNTGTTNVETFWFSWIPGYDFMSAAPTSLTAPAGWSVSNQQDTFSPPGYYSTQWVTTSNPLASSQTLSGFNFTSTLSPTAITDPSYFGSFYPVSTAYVYQGAPETDAGASFFATQATPEPAALSLLAISALFLRRPGRGD